MRIDVSAPSIPEQKGLEFLNTLRPDFSDLLLLGEKVSFVKVYI